MFSKGIDLAHIRPSSKMTLKLTCLEACGNDVDRAEKLYSYLASDLCDLPDIDPVMPSAMERVISGADTVAGWFTAHQGDIMQAISMLRSLRNVPGASAAADTVAAGVPPIPTEL